MLFLPLIPPRPSYPTKLHVLSLYIEKKWKENKQKINKTKNKYHKKTPLLNTNTQLEKKWVRFVLWNYACA